jgi:hypothetical protein
MSRRPPKTAPFERCSHCGYVLLWMGDKLVCPNVDCPQRAIGAKRP